MKKILLSLLLTTLTTVSFSFSATLSKNLKIGSRGEDVKVLQQKLVEEGFLSTENVTGQYGKVTAKAVSQLQSKYGIKSVGYVGPQTLKVINGLRKNQLSNENIIIQTQSNATNRSKNTDDTTATQDEVVPSSTKEIINSAGVVYNKNTQTDPSYRSFSRSDFYKKILDNNKDLRTGFVRPSFATSTNGRTKLIVRYKNAPTKENEEKIASLSGKKRKPFNLVPLIAAEVSDTDIDKISSDPNVLSIEKDEEVSIDSSGEYKNTWGVSQIGSEAVYNAGFTGKGVKVAVLDTGIDYNHQDLFTNYAGGYNFVTGSTDPYDNNGHGTHVSGTITASNNGSGVVGVAPGTKIYALKVLDANGNGYSSNIIQALEWAIDNGIQVVNLSLGTTNYPGTAMEDAFINAEAKGLVIVASSGNNGTCGGDTDTINYPAKFPSVISVGAVDINNQHACFSASGAKLDLSAPGVSINSTKLGGGNTLYSGTSMASPHVSGAASVIIGSGVNDKNGDGKISDEVRDVLKKTSTDLGDVGVDSVYGFGLINVDNAVTYVRSLNSTTTPAVIPVPVSTTTPIAIKPVATTTPKVVPVPVPVTTTKPIATSSPTITPTPTKPIDSVVPPTTLVPIATTSPVIPEPSTSPNVPKVQIPKIIIPVVTDPVITRPTSTWPIYGELPDKASDRAKLEQELKKIKEETMDFIKKEDEKNKEFLRKTKEETEELIKKQNQELKEELQRNTEYTNSVIEDSLKNYPKSNMNNRYKGDGKNRR